MEECNVLVNGDRLIGVTISDVIDEMPYKPMSL